MHKTLAALTLLIVAASLTFCPSVALADAVANCRQDLAKRLGVAADQIEVVSAKPQTFPDASLGLPQPGFMYAQVLTPGKVIILKGKSVEYLYTASARAIRYGGPVAAWRHSALYLEPVEDEPNLNGNLCQVSLMGTNPVLLASEVSEFWPQANGTIIAASRTSRSSFGLLHVTAQGQVTQLGDSFAYDHGAVNKDGTQWAVFERPRLGEGWRFTWGPVAERPETKSLDLPPACALQRIYWGLDRPIIVVNTPDKTKTYQMNESSTGWEETPAHVPPANGDMMLNKGETLVVKTEQVDGKPVTRVVRRWFNGDEKSVAAISDFTSEEVSITPEQRFVMLSGKRGDKPCAFTVDLASGEVLTTVPEAKGSTRLFLAPARTKLGLEL